MRSTCFCFLLFSFGGNALAQAGGPCAAAALFAKQQRLILKCEGLHKNILSTKSDRERLPIHNDLQKIRDYFKACTASVVKAKSIFFDPLLARGGVQDSIQAFESHIATAAQHNGNDGAALAAARAANGSAEKINVMAEACINGLEPLLGDAEAFLEDTKCQVPNSLVGPIPATGGSDSYQKRAAEEAYNREAEWTGLVVRDLQSAFTTQTGLLNSCKGYKQTALELNARAFDISNGIQPRVAQKSVPSSEPDASSAQNSSDGNANEMQPLMNGPDRGGYHTQPVEKKPNKLMNAMKQVGPGALGALMAGAGMLAGQGGNKASQPKPQQAAPQQQTPEAKPIADAKPPAKDSDVEKMKAETEKTNPALGGGSRDLTKQDSSLVKLKGGVEVTDTLDKDGNLVKREKTTHDPVSGEKEVQDATSEADANGPLTSGGNNTVGASQGAETGAQLASGSTSSGRALAGDSSGASGGYLGSGGYVGTGRSHSYGGGGEAGADGAAPAVDSNYIGAGYAGEADSGAGVQSAPGRRRRRSALPICGPNSKANGVACQEIQKLRDDRAERKKGVINTDEYLNIAPASTRKR